jgi:hypothetical protein
MPKTGVLVSIPTLAVAALALCWIAPPRGLEAAAETRTDFSVSKQLFDPEALGSVRTKFTGSESRPTQAAVEGRSVGRSVEPATQMRQAPAAPQCEPSAGARRFEPQYG